jgi:hypothetical protein
VLAKIIPFRPLTKSSVKIRVNHMETGQIVKVLSAVGTGRTVHIGEIRWIRGNEAWIHRFGPVSLDRLAPLKGAQH